MLKLTTPWRLRKLGIMGMNARNHAFIQHFNERRHFPGVDDKLMTRKLTSRASIRGPKLLGVVRFQHEVKHLREQIAEHDSFVIKPSKGSVGKGILVIKERCE